MPVSAILHGAMALPLEGLSPVASVQSEVPYIFGIHNVDHDSSPLPHHYTRDMTLTPLLTHDNVPF